MQSASSLANPLTEAVRFEISDEAAVLIRNRGGQAWIWSNHYGHLQATTGPPVLHKPEWSTCKAEDLVVHIDGAIVPPTRWVLATAEGALVAGWEGRNPDLFGRLPLVRPEDDSVEDPEERTSSPLAHLRRTLVVPAIAWAFAVLWALRFIGVTGAWLWAGQVALVAALSLAGLIVWLHEKLAELREDNALAKDLETHFARSRARRNG